MTEHKKQCHGNKIICHCKQVSVRDIRIAMVNGARTLDDIKEIDTIPLCSCGNKARFNARKINGKFVFEGEQVAIDNENNVEYESLCPVCYLKEKNK